MINKDNFEIRIIRETERYNFEGKLSSKMHDEVLTNNRFIYSRDNSPKIIIATPFCRKVEDCFNKLVELHNVVITELYTQKELIWPNGIIYFDVKTAKNDNIEDYIKEVLKEYNIDIDSMEEKKDKIIRMKFNADIHEIVGVNKKTLKFLSMLLNNNKTDNNKVLKYNFLQQNDKNNDLLKLARRYANIGYKARYMLTTCKELYSENTALIKDALYCGIDYNIINPKKGIVEFINSTGHSEFIVDGNETAKDSYIYPIITDDKYLVKQILLNNGLNVPDGFLIQKNMTTQEKEKILKNIAYKKAVIKPRNTNYGIGITILKENVTIKQLKTAINYAFKFDDDVIIEEYVEGKEYRFLVIDNKCVSVVFRRSASVIGNGKSTIKELIDKKNKEPWHYLTETPIIIDDIVQNFLENQGYNLNSVIDFNKRIYLRENSNCSTGGESIDVTPNIPEQFKKIAEKAAKCFKAKVTGIDIIINNLDYSIIEINDTPGYTINEWPYEGKGEKIGIDILKLVKLLED